MKTIKLKSGEYKINHFDYVWCGVCLLTVSLKTKQILESVPKKYYIDIFLSNHSVSDCGDADTIPSTVDLRRKGWKYLKMERSL